MTPPLAASERWRLLPYFRPHVGRASLAGLSMAARAAVLVLTPWPLKYIMDSVILHHAPPVWLVTLIPGVASSKLLLLNVLAFSLFALGVADSWLNYEGNRLFLSIGQRTMFAARCDLFRHLMRLPMSFHRAQRGGDIMTRMIDDISRLQDLVAELGTGLLPHGLTILGIVVVMFIVDWRYALITISLAPVLMGLTHVWGKWQRRLLLIARKRDGDLWSLTQERLAVVPLVQACRAEAFEDRRFAQTAGASLEAGLKLSQVQAPFAPMINLIIAVSTGIITWYGAIRVLDKALTAGDMLMFLAYLRALVTPARQLAKSGPIFGRAMVAVARLRDIFSVPPGFADRTGVRAPAVCRGELEFRNVSFAYEPGQSTLRHINLRIEPGMMVALVGPSGAGKTSMVSLAARFADPNEGVILLDGKDLRDLPLDHVRRKVMVMQQESLLLHGTVWENIAYGRPGATREDAIAAAHAVGVDVVLSRLEDGYDRMVGERGGMLSGGQKQCIAIARAMLSGAPVVVLDEPSSNLDALTESRIVHALNNLSASRACIVIAHRLVSVRSADLIVVLEGGLIVQSGTHDELLLAGGLYARMWRSQNSDHAVPHLARQALCHD